jgi:hypothetical protein
MTTLFDVHLPLEQAYRRRVLLAVELLDAVTLSRVSDGVRVIAEGLAGKPVVNLGGRFVWLEEDITALQRIVVEPGALPFDRVERSAADVQLPLTTIELSPRVNYAFPSGITALRGTLIEETVSPPATPVPVSDAAVHLQWLADDGNWQDAPTVSTTAIDTGDFAAVLRLKPTQMPLLGANGTLTARVRVRRGAEERGSSDLALVPGRVTDPSASNPLVFAWNELQP